MTANGRFKRFKTRFRPELLLSILLLSSCASSPVSDAPKNRAPADAAYELFPKTVQDGSIVRVTLSLPDALRSMPVSGDFEGKEIPFYWTTNGAAEAVVGIPHSHAPGDAVFKVKIGPSQNLSVAIPVTAANWPSENITVEPSKVNPPQKEMARIKREVAEAAAIYARLTEKKYWSAPFILPINSPVTSVFGGKRMYNGEMRSFHPGMDLKAPMGTPIHAAAAGVVVLSKNLFFTGNTVMIDHGYGVVTLYAHMSKRKVKKGDIVTQGQLLGLSGMTGRASGPHLHWGAYIHGTKVNPMDLTRVMR